MQESGEIDISFSPFTTFHCVHYEVAAPSAHSQTRYNTK
jgi:hypothetical protein